MALSTFWCLGLCPTAARLCTSHCSSSSCWSISSVSQGPSVGRHVSGVSAAPLGHVSPSVWPLLLSVCHLQAGCRYTAPSSRWLVMMLNSTGPSTGPWSAPLVTGLNFVPMMGVSFLVSGSEWQGGENKKSLDCLLLGAEGSLCEQDAKTQRDVAVFARDFAWQVGRGAFRGDVCFCLVSQCQFVQFYHWSWK